MEYRRLGMTGLKSSALTFGTGALHNLRQDAATDIVRRAYDGGITHFDTAESYGGMQTEARLGEVLRALGLGREKYILSTKAFTYGWSDPGAAPHEVRTLNRKYLLNAIDRSLRKLGTDFVDIYYCHEPDPHTPVEEIACAMDDIVRAGKARYWAVSNWTAESIAALCAFTDRFGRHRPIIDQIEYNLLHRARADKVRATLRQYGLGIAVWGPLAGGLLSGKYLKGVPGGSRAADPQLVATGISERLLDSQRNALVEEIGGVAAEIGCTVGQLAIGWCLTQPEVSTVLIAASNPGQLDENLGAVAASEKLTPDLLERLRAIVGDYDKSNIPEALPLA